MSVFPSAELSFKKLYHGNIKNQKLVDACSFKPDVQFFLGPMHGFNVVEFFVLDDKHGKFKTS